jgi:hypothetical protein
MYEHQEAHQSKNPEPSSQRRIVLSNQTHTSNPAAIIQSSRIDTKSLTPTDVFQLHRTIGNKAVGRLLSEVGKISSTTHQAPIQRQEIPEEEEPLQGVFEKEPEQSTCFGCPIVSIKKKEENRTGIPDNLKAGVENLSGIDISNVRVHYNSPKPADMGALAYTQGTDIHVAPGQERYLPHEAWHVVQQAQGRVQPTMQMKGLKLNDDVGLEQEADAIGERVLQVRLNSSCATFEENKHSSSMPINASGTIREYTASTVVQRGSKPILENFYTGELSELRKDRIKESLSKELKSEITGEKEKSKDEILSIIVQNVNLRIDEAVEKCEDTLELAAALEKIKFEMGLKSINMIKLGTPSASVEFEINPWYYHPIPPGKIIYRMVGTHATPISDVYWESENLNIGSQTTEVGIHMVSNPLAPDFEPGSKSTNDTVQDGLMKELANAGNTGVANDQKYIKGHLLNDHVGGPGLSFNLFPITADANAKHLAYVEKFVKAQLHAGYVIYYELRVSHKAPQDVNKDGKKPYSIDADFNFYWYLLDTSGKQIKAVHNNKIESIYNTTGSVPFDVTSEYAGEYDKLNSGKTSPKPIPQTGQRMEPSITPAAMSPMHMPTTPATFAMPSGFLVIGSSIPDFSTLPIKIDSGLNFISVRNAHAPNAGDTIRVSTGSVVVTSINQLGGGWTRVYF